MSTIVENVASLKAEGNAFFAKKEYQPAIEKYTEALRGRATIAKDARDLPKAIELALQACANYLQASRYFPEDDERHAWLLDCSVTHALNISAPLHVSLPIMHKLREAVPKMQRIWINSALAHGGRDARLAKTLLAETEAMEQLNKGIIDMNDPFTPSSSAW
ncbi:hypothetical protein HGRIS_003405 [Hohenbuehelia grisea]|uniref:Uncharacterized protein n=1 Tax=Hohenbuehelia grisea TaxID=104357 RepID=A0ABR3JFC7_9AGAR